MKTEYDVTKNMLKTIRTITESKTSKKSINEQIEGVTPSEQPSSEESKNDITVINNVDVKLNSTDKQDLKISDTDKNAISQLIDGFSQQVSQIVEFDPGMTINQNQIRLDGYLPDEDVHFVFIAGKEAGIYINAEMLKLEQNIANILEKLAKFNETFKTSMEPLLKERYNN
jgi:flagellar motility protein MotE (MotC chaperone)